MKRIIGITMIVAVFVYMFVDFTLSGGLLEALKTFGIGSFVLAWVGIAVHLSISN